MREPLQSGFTLLEVVVAFTIFAFAFAAVMQISSQNAQVSQIADDYDVAVSYAQSLIARSGSDTNLSVGTDNGTLANGMSWRRSINPYVPGDSGVDRPTAYRIDVEFTWTQHSGLRQVQFSTLRPAAGS